MLTNNDDNNDFDGNYANTVDINDGKADDHNSDSNDADVVYENVNNDNNAGAALPLLTDANCNLRLWLAGYHMQSRRGPKAHMTMDDRAYNRFQQPIEICNWYDAQDAFRKKLTDVCILVIQTSLCRCSLDEC
eukprot:scaffold550979_cov18-Prasinocladus_malaysianus.AAC.1